MDDNIRVKRKEQVLVSKEFPNLCFVEMHAMSEESSDCYGAAAHKLFGHQDVDSSLC